MLKKFTSVNLIIQVFLLFFCFTGKALLAEEAKIVGSEKSISLVGVKKIFLHAQNSKLKLSQFSIKKQKMQIFSNFNSLLDKVIVKKLKKGNNLHIWILKNTFFGEKKNIKEGKYIGEILIKMPALPVVLTQALGSTSIEFWKSSLIINKWSGKVQVKNTQAKITIFSQKGIVSIDNYKGKLKIESYDNQLNINNSEGNFNFNIFSGAVALNKLKANIQLSTYSASLVAEDIEGRLVVGAEHSSIKLENIRSTTKVNLVKGKVKVNNIGAISLHVASLGRASINVNLNGRAAKLSLLSQRFKTKVPSGLKHKSLGRGEQVKGFVSGTSPKAFIVLKSKEGRITLKP